MQTNIINNNSHLQIVEDIKTCIVFHTNSSTHILLKILNENEDTVRLLLNEKVEAGEHKIPFHSSNLNKGKYIVRLMIDDGKSIEIENTVIHI